MTSLQPQCYVQIASNRILILGYPVWIDRRLAVDSSSHPYGWCCRFLQKCRSSYIRLRDYFSSRVKVHKCSSSTGTGDGESVTLRIQDRLSNRLHQNQTSTLAPVVLITQMIYTVSVRDLCFQKREPAQSFLWSFVMQRGGRELRLRYACVCSS